MAVPKRKTSQARRDKRRAANNNLKAPGMVKCPKCQALILPHRVCSECGSYGGKEIIKKEA